MELGQKIRQLRTRLGLSQTAFGKLFRPTVSREAVSQWETGETQPSSLNLQQLTLLAGENIVLSGGNETLVTASMPQYRVMVRGAVQGGHFAEAVERPTAEWYQVLVPLSGRYALLNPYALEVIGPSMNQTFPPGTILICVNVYDLPKPFKFEVDQYYIVHRRQPDGRIEATVKRVRRSADGSYWLWPESDHPDFQAPIPAAGRPGDEVKVTGRVIKAIRDYD